MFWLLFSFFILNSQHQDKFLCSLNILDVTKVLTHLSICFKASYPKTGGVRKTMSPMYRQPNLWVAAAKGSKHQ